MLALPVTVCAQSIDALMENGHWKRARGLAEAEYRAHPSDARANFLMSSVRHEFQRLDEAAKYGEAAVRLDPKSSLYHRRLGEIYADLANTASFLKQLGLARKIRAEFDAALALAPKDPDNLFDHMQYFQEAPGVAGGDKKKAIQVANEILQVDAARGYLAQAYLARMAKEENALESLYQKAIAANPRDYGAHIQLAGYSLDARHENAARTEQQAQAALELNPDRIDAYRLLAFALVLQKRFDDAAKVLGRAEAAIPDDLSPYVSTARAMLRTGSELPQAEGYLKKYISETKEPEANSPPVAGAHWSLGLVYEKEGRKGDAKAELETALRLRPDFEPAKRDLKRLK